MSIHVRKTTAPVLCYVGKPAILTPERTATLNLVILVTPYFNLAATMSFIDPFRAANYLTGSTTFRWHVLSAEGGMVMSSSGLAIETAALTETVPAKADLVLVSSSWTPEQSYSDVTTSALNRWAREGAIVGGIDTGAFVLANAGLLKNRRATSHYEHIDALMEMAADTAVCEDLFVVDGRLFTCCGGTAASDAALHYLSEFSGPSIANAAARYVFHHDVRGAGRSQNPKRVEPTGHVTPSTVRKAIDLMEANLEDPIPIPEICKRVAISQRQLGRLFTQYVHKTPVEYYRDIRLDRARGLVTQTEMKLSEVAAASGFNSQVHFSRCYQQKFGLAPNKDRIEGRVPFEFRAWPMHNPRSS